MVAGWSESAESCGKRGTVIRYLGCRVLMTVCTTALCSAPLVHYDQDMSALIPMPDERGPAGASRTWINPSHIVLANAIIDRQAQPNKLYVELKLVGMNVTRYWLATGSVDELQAAWDTFAEKIASA